MKKADSICTLELLAGRINRKEQLGLYDIHVVNDAIDELAALRRTVAKLVAAENSQPTEVASRAD